jgi:hypothetical protein
MDDIDTDDERALKKLWLNDVPSEVSIFGWRLLSEKLPTREALARQGIILTHMICAAFFVSWRLRTYILFSLIVGFQGKFGIIL